MALFIALYPANLAQAEKQASLAPDPAAQLQAMSRLDYMVGHWEGEGWTEMNGVRHTFHGTELIQRKLAGVALLYKVTGMSQPTRVGSALLPAIRASAFTFSSLSDAV